MTSRVPDATSVLLVVDVQRDFCEQRAGFAVYDHDPLAPTTLAPVVHAVAALVAQWSPSAGPIVVVRSHYAERQFARYPRLCVEGTPGAELMIDVHASPHAVLFTKHTHDAFACGALAPLLRALAPHAASVYIAGVTTDWCVRETALGAVRAGLRPTVVADAVGAVFQRRCHHFRFLHSPPNGVRVACSDTIATVVAMQRSPASSSSSSSSSPSNVDGARATVPTAHTLAPSSAAQSTVALASHSALPSPSLLLSPQRNVRKTVAIVGAGIAGLFVAAAMVRREGTNNVDVHVYERDASLCARRQGYALTMQAPVLKLLERYAGVAADDLRAYGGESRFRWYVDGRSGETLHRKEHRTPVRQRTCVVPREALRRHLCASAVAAGATVHWGADVDAERVAAEFVPTHDLVVAADGAHSALRARLVPDAPLRAFHLVNVYGFAAVDDGRAGGRLHGGHVQVLDGTHRLFVKPFDAQRTMWQMTWPAAYQRAQFAATSRGAALAACERYIAEQWPNVAWALALVRATRADDVSVHALHDLDPSGVRWRDAPLVFVGDAAHPMSPYLGLGANQAIRNAAVLVRDGVDAYHSALADATSGAARAVRNSRERTMFCHTPQAIDTAALYAMHGWSTQ